MRLSRLLAPRASLVRLGSARPSLMHSRALSSSATTFDVASWTDKWLDAVKEVPAATDPAKSADVLRQLVRTDLLSFTDMRDAPEKFFLAHRLLATVGLGGFGVRFTVQFNLFAGSIVGLGGPEQVESLKSIQQAGQLGCFLLTEMQAGVLSGLIVETTCDWDPATQSFMLHTPSDKAAKNWISQGYTAELGVVIADLRIAGKSHGPHAFVMRMRDESGALLPGIRVEDMGTKTVANDLDNARVWFDQVRLPKEALLNRFADIRDDQYVQTTAERMRIEVIGQRLLTGRLAIAEAAISSCRVLHMRTEEYARQKVCNGIAGEVMLSEMPQLRDVFDASYAALDEMAAFTAGVEARLNECLRSSTIPDDDLVDAIAVAKIRCIDVALERAHALRKEVGVARPRTPSHALVAPSKPSVALSLAGGLVCADARDRIRARRHVALLQICGGRLADPPAEADARPAAAAAKGRRERDGLGPDLVRVARRDGRGAQPGTQAAAGGARRAEAWQGDGRQLAAGLRGGRHDRGAARAHRRARRLRRGRHSRAAAAGGDALRRRVEGEALRAGGADGARDGGGGRRRCAAGRGRRVNERGGVELERSGSRMVHAHV